MRGLAVVIMIQCHVFNSFARLDLRDGGPYVLSQFVGGMAAPLFLFMAGMTLAFQMDGLERREPRRRDRWLKSLKRAGFVLGIAFLFRLTNWIASLPAGSLEELTKVDILNCMGVGLMAFSAAAMFNAKDRARFGVLGGLAVAALAPIVSGLEWDGAPALLREYLVPGPGRGRFPFFPCASYIGFGLAAGAIVKRVTADRIERLMQWCLLGGVALIFSALYFSNLPYSIYENADFWKNSPALILIRTGIAMVMMAGAYLWTEPWSRGGWSWMATLGKASLMVYWVHVMLVYGNIAKPVKRALSIPQTVFATALITALMVAATVGWLRWKERRAVRRRPVAVEAEPEAVVTTIAGSYR